MPEVEAQVAPYTPPSLSPALDTFAASLGIPAHSVDWSDIGTHATVGAPVSHRAGPSTIPTGRSLSRSLTAVSSPPPPRWPAACSHRRS